MVPGMRERGMKRRSGKACVGVLKAREVKTNADAESMDAHLQFKTRAGAPL
jgi:hypothetical protein